MAQNAIGPGSLVASRFRLEDLLDEHSGARFWRATDLILARNVAIHVIPPDDPRGPAVLTAARTSATVSDPRILRVLDALEKDGVVYVVHEWGAGVSLDRMVSEEPLDARRAAWLVREVAEAVVVAHRHGIAHGRLLPENVLLTDAGSVKLIGFVVDAVLRGRGPATEGAPALEEHEADIRNLGALLYASVTGRWPGTPTSLVPDAPRDHGRLCRPRQVRPGVPSAIDALCDQVLNSRPRGGRPRFDTAEAVRVALSEYLGESAHAAHVPVSEATAFLDPDSFPRNSTPGTLGSFDAFPPGQVGAADQAPADPAVTEHRDPESAAVAEAAAAQPETPQPETPASPDLPAPQARTGVVPAHWGPDRPEGVSPSSGEPERRPGSVPIRIAALLGVLTLLLLAIVVGFYLGRSEPADESTPDEARSSSEPSAEPIEVAAVSAFDPDGSGALGDENPSDVDLVIDGDEATSWQTVGYDDGPVLAPFKSGVGLLLDLGADQQVGQVAVSLVGAPYDVQLLAASEGSASPTDITDLTEVDTRSGASGTVTLVADDPVTTRYLVVWLTAVPQAGDDGRYRGTIAEVDVRP